MWKMDCLPYMCVLLAVVVRLRSGTQCCADDAAGLAGVNAAQEAIRRMQSVAAGKVYVWV